MSTFVNSAPDTHSLLNHVNLVTLVDVRSLTYSIYRAPNQVTGVRSSHPQLRQ